MSRTKVTKSSGNVFRDLGFAREEAMILAMRSDLMGQLRLLIERKRWTQAQAAARAWRRAVPHQRPHARQMGKVQPRHALASGRQGRAEASADVLEGRVARKSNGINRLRFARSRPTSERLNRLRFARSRPVAVGHWQEADFRQQARILTARQRACCRVCDLLRTPAASEAKPVSALATALSASRSTCRRRKRRTRRCRSSCRRRQCPSI